MKCNNKFGERAYSLPKSSGLKDVIEPGKKNYSNKKHEHIKPELKFNMDFILENVLHKLN